MKLEMRSLILNMLKKDQSHRQQSHLINKKATWFSFKTSPQIGYYYHDI
jgi:hypothetical protein